jgi:hypothetical protein
MKKYKFSTTVYRPVDINKPIENGYISEIKNEIMYKCLICGYTHDWDDTWSDEKKAEVKSEVDIHHNEHNIPDEIDGNI